MLLCSSDERHIAVARCDDAHINTIFCSSYDRSLRSQKKMGWEMMVMMIPVLSKQNEQNRVMNLDRTRGKEIRGGKVTGARCRTQCTVKCLLYVFSLSPYVWLQDLNEHSIFKIFCWPNECFDSLLHTIHFAAHNKSKSKHISNELNRDVAARERREREPTNLCLMCSLFASKELKKTVWRSCTAGPSIFICVSTNLPNASGWEQEQWGSL